MTEDRGERDANSKRSKMRPTMKMQEIRKIGRSWGVNCSVVRSKQDLIRDIQVREGFSPCFRTREICDQDCLWKPDCLKNETIKGA